MWTGSRFLLWGGVATTGLAVDGALYDPVEDSWVSVPPAPVAGRLYMASAWSGTELIIWGGSALTEGGEQLSDGARFDPIAGTWRSVAPSPLRPRQGPASIWMNDSMLVWGGSSIGPTGPFKSGLLSDGARYDPSNEAWSMLPSGPLTPRVLPNAAWTGDEALVWGGIGGDVTRAGEIERRGGLFGCLDEVGSVGGTGSRCRRGCARFAAIWAGRSKGSAISLSQRDRRLMSPRA